MAAETELTTAEEVRVRARELYTREIRERVETPETIGLFVTIDILTGDYEAGPNHIANVAAVRARHKNVQTCTLRVGYTTTYSRGGGMVRAV